ncbi:ABC transporter permease [Tessaracoccus defluvii]|nr:ABC transporter permease [Tessaracoccus defluvii]
MTNLTDANKRVDSVVRGFIERAQGNRSVLRMVLVLVVAFSVFAFLNPKVFLGPLNLQNIMVASPEIGVIAIAMMLAMLTGGIDLSLVSIANLSAITMSTMFTALVGRAEGFNEAMAIPVLVVGILVGVGCGLLNGVLIGIVGITPILATLGTMQVLNGIAIVWTGGSTLYGAPATFTTFGKMAVGPVPLLFLVFLVAAVVIAFLVNSTTLGRKIELQGANPVAARFSGIRSKAVLIGSYAVGGALGGLAGFLFLARNPTASADYGASYVLLVIVIAVLGGTNPNGGFASVAGVVLATITLQVVSSGFTALRLSSYQYAIAQGVILVAVMVIDAINWRGLRAKPATRAVAASN